MVSKSDDLSTRGEHQLHECSLDEETETCIDVRDLIL